MAIKIDVVPYTEEWKYTFGQIKEELAMAAGFLNPVIEHIGSTSVEGLAAKPIIDILVGLKREQDLDLITQPLMNMGYIYYEKYNEDMPYRRFFVKLKVQLQLLSLPLLIDRDTDIPASLQDHNGRLAHIHALPLDSEHWLRHIAFRDYLRAYPEIKAAYQQLKEGLSTREWSDGNAYNEAKDAFLKTEEQNAIRWYQERKQGFNRN